MHCGRIDAFCRRSDAPYSLTDRSDYLTDASRSTCYVVQREDMMEADRCCKIHMEDFYAHPRIGYAHTLTKADSHVWIYNRLC